ncbi:MAG: nucleotide exchange factor GrpE [Acidobacteriota bacterium]
MTSDQRNQNDEFGADVHGAEPESVEDFIKALEAKEKDLHISSEMVIEVEGSDFDDLNIPDFIANEIAPVPAKPPVLSAKPVIQTPPVVAPNTQKELNELKQKVKVLVNEKADLHEKSLRRLKEFENFKTRMERERTDTFKNQLANLATKMLPVLDNLNRALDFSAAVPIEKRIEMEEFFDGIVLVNHQINDVFAGMGVQQIPAIGEEFDPNVHEAVSTDESGTYAPNIVSDEFLKGYRIGDRVIRHSMVKVSKPAVPKTPPPVAALELPEAFEPELEVLSEISIAEPDQAE